MNGWKVLAFPLESYCIIVECCVTAPCKVQPVQRLQVLYAHSLLCTVFAEAEDSIKGPVPPGRYCPYYYDTADEIVCSTGSSEGEIHRIDPPLQPNEEGWFDRYDEHLRRRAAGDVGPIKTIPKIRNTPIGPALYLLSTPSFLSRPR